LWRNHPEREATWETEESIRTSYPHFLPWYVLVRPCGFLVLTAVWFACCLFGIRLLVFGSWNRLCFIQLPKEALDTFCNTFHIPEEVHPVLPNQYGTLHERPAGKIGLYTRFFDFANFRLPLSTFLVDILGHFRINISQLSVIRAAKVSHFEILCRVYRIVATVGLFRCFYVNSKKSGWMSFSKRSDNASHTAKHVIRDPFAVGADFNAQDYATLVAHPSSFWKFPKAFMYLVGLSRHYPLDEENHPRFVYKNGEVAPDRAESELEAGGDRLFDEGGSGHQTEQGDSAGVGKMLTFSQLLRLVDTIVEDAALAQLRRQGKRKLMVVDTSGASQPPEKLRGDHGTPSGASLLCPPRKREDEDHTDVVAEPNLCTIGAPQRFVISLNSSHHSGPTIAEAKVDSLVRSSAHIMTIATIVTPMVDSALVAVTRPKIQCSGIPFGVLLHSIKYKLQKTTLSETF
nr:hypothetical protein [Tanacetum cinerariifolium]